VAARTKACVRCSSLAGITGSNPAGDMYVSFDCCVLSGVASGTGRSFVQRSPTDCGVIWKSQQ